MGFSAHKMTHFWMLWPAQGGKLHEYLNLKVTLVKQEKMANIPSIYLSILRCVFVETVVHLWSWDCQQHVGWFSLKLTNTTQPAQSFTSHHLENTWHAIGLVIDSS